MFMDACKSEERLQHSPSGLACDHKQVKHESPCFLVFARTLPEIKPETNEFAPSADDDLDSEVDDDTTLKQLQLLTKKRKHILIRENSKQDNAYKKAAQDESDLNEPLVKWKPNCPNISKANKKRCLKKHVISSSTIDVTVKSEQHFVSECSPKVCRELAPVGNVELEVPEAEQLGCRNKTSGDASFIEIQNPGQKMVPNEPNREAPSCVNIYGNCVTNEISYDHLEDVDYISILVPRDRTSFKSETPESSCSEFLDFHSAEIENQREIQDSHSWMRSLSEEPYRDLCSHSGNSSSVEDMHEGKSISVTQVPDMAIDVCVGLHQECNSVPSGDKPEVDVPCQSNDSLNNLHKNCGSILDSITPSKSKEHQTFMQDTVVDMELPSTISITRNKLYCEGHIGGESLKAVDKQHSDDIYLDNRTHESIETVLIPEPYQLADKQNSAFIMIGAEMKTVLKQRTCDIAEKIMILEQHQPPKRLRSTHKAFSPSSEEQLRLALNSCKTCKDSNQNLLECEKKLFENQTEESSPRSDIQNDEVTVHHGYPGKVSQRKVTTRPRCMIRKSQIAKGNLDGHRFSRAFPNLITGCTTVQACSESAIAFSQRQMHDIESLAKKLMNELKSMKDIIEQKLLFEAYRNASVKNDADGVKSAIDKTTKVEETAKRLISMMARDCTRFCKIMKMTPDSTSTSKDRVTSIRRKIMFADEAGGELCQIKYFDDGVATQVPDQS